MSTAQKRVLAVLSGLMAVVLVGVLLVATRGDDPNHVETTAADSLDRGEASNEQAEEQPRTTETTLYLEPVTPGQPSGPPPTAPPTTAPAKAPSGPTSPQSKSSAPVVTAEGALMTKPAVAAPRTLDAKRCPTPQQGWTSRECGAVNAEGVVLVWSIESKGNGLRAVLLRESAGGQWTSVLSAADENGSRWSSIRVAADDVSGDGSSEIGFGFHLKGPERVLAVDLVEGPGRVVVHQDLPGGAAQVEPGRLDLWAAERPGDQSVTHSVIQFVDDSYRRTSTLEERRAELPPSEL